MMQIQSQSIIIACAVASIGSGASLADTITLKPSVRLKVNADAVHLADIAELDGPDAAALAELPVANMTDRNAVLELTVRDIRQKLDDAGVHWGRLNLNGNKVVVRPGRNPAVMPPLAMTAVNLNDDGSSTTKESRRDDMLASDVIDSPTLRGTVANLIVTNLRLDPKNLRLSFDPADGELLDTRVEAARFEVQPLSSFASDRIDMTIRTWADGKVQRSRTVSILPKVRLLAASLRADVQKDQMIADSDIVEQEQWLPPSQSAQIVNRVSAIGRIANRSLRAGDTLRDVHVRRETLIKRGDLVTVRCLVGGAVISLQAEARADGGEGDAIEFRKQGERDTFLATVSGRNEAVIDLSRR